MIALTMTAKYGGPVQVIAGMSKGFKRRGHYVEIWSCDKGIPDDCPVDLKCVPLRCLGSFFTPLALSPCFAREAVRRVKEFDLVRIHGLYRFPFSFGAWISLLKGVPYIIQTHGTLDPFLHGQSRFGKWAVPLKLMYESFIDIPLMNRASAVHYTSEEEERLVKSYLPVRSRSFVVPNGLDWERYEKLPVYGAFRSRIGVGLRTPLVLFLGRINFKKGLDILIPAFKQVVDRMGRDVRLVIVGPDNEGYGSQVRKWCKEYGVLEQVIFTGHIKDRELIKQAYVDSDVFVLPSYAENFGVAVIEAMACGCPVVISDKVNIWREVERSGGGVIAELSSFSVADSICSVLALSREHRVGVGRMARIFVKENFSWEEIVKKLEEIQAEIVEDHRVKMKQRRVHG